MLARGILGSFARKRVCPFVCCWFVASMAVAWLLVGWLVACLVSWWVRLIIFCHMLLTLGWFVDSLGRRLDRVLVLSLVT